MPAIITLLTDFGLANAYAGIMRGVILGINPAATVVDLTHEVPPQDIRYAAFELATAWPYFPPGTVHAVVVDPGVGSERAALAARVGEQYFVAPDNGVLSYVLAEGYSALVRLTQPRYWLPHTSHTFHGRDIFAPVAAHLSLGVPLAALGEPYDRPVTFPLPQPERRPDGSWLAHVIHVDRFGNLVTDLPAARQPLAGVAGALVAGRRIDAVVRTYAEAPVGSPAVLEGSAGYLEIAVRNGSARQELGAGVGSQVVFLSGRPILNADPQA
ncbi:MAG: SAM-dependent chlorinase/fluorinase [Anaerolineae bacterium]|nr:SAM-dependent chlorinase/fluorinase [Anaerolineae bacterium]